MGSIIAMVAVVTIVAGIATVTTKQLHSVFSGGTPKDTQLKSLLAKWREELVPERTELISLKDEELDLLGQKPAVDRKLLKAKNRTAGRIQTIYQENVAVFISQAFPKAKVDTNLILIQTKGAEYVFRKQGLDVFVAINGSPEGILRGDEFTPAGTSTPTARLETQPDQRTVHADAGNRTLGILLVAGIGNQVVPRAFEFVDIQSVADRSMLETLTFYYLVTQNLGS
ncbi:MAG: hypothetical protein AB8F78_02710 [Saprospiraceae bacterium]